MPLEQTLGTGETAWGAPWGAPPLADGGDNAVAAQVSSRALSTTSRSTVSTSRGDADAQDGRVEGVLGHVSDIHGRHLQ